ncbi:hypothetical protein TRFO_20009 [Tritrichomonas foetus]|uniref:Uncharacterized protein n=1 Tax=Tritrichomonas foetus TaxID=1144522 RepID=A0A1J4KGS3_9EUKA|nr:hypothetical protein TRFO_20009 [Tritrichomonas foetus]|eukprot:OHT10607.1 hypothetical protein TRFO_20009 [Tritrichomonas foetus]
MTYTRRSLRLKNIYFINSDGSWECHKLDEKGKLVEGMKRARRIVRVRRSKAPKPEISQNEGQIPSPPISAYSNNSIDSFNQTQNREMPSHTIPPNFQQQQNQPQFSLNASSFNQNVTGVYLNQNFDEIQNTFIIDQHIYNLSENHDNASKDDIDLCKYQIGVNLNVTPTNNFFQQSSMDYSVFPSEEECEWI